MKHGLYVAVGLVVTTAATTAAAAGKIKAAKTEANNPDVAVLDKSVSPCDDFYQYACGPWIKANPIPPDQSRWGRFNALREKNLGVLRGILENAAKVKKRDADTQKLGDFYAACMDDKSIDKKSLEPLTPTLTRIIELKDKSALPSMLAALHAEGNSAFFELGAEPDMKNATLYVATTDQGGLGLPDRDYYTRQDAKSLELLRKYSDHVAAMFVLSGDAPALAAQKASVVVAIESKLAQGSLDRISRRDPLKMYHKMTVTELGQLSPSFAWDEYLAASSAAPKFSQINVTAPDFIKAVESTLATTSLDDLKTYLVWHQVHAAAPMLSEPFVLQNFDFYGKTLTGAKELKPRWKRCVTFTDYALGEALGRAYVEKAFGPRAKQALADLVAAIESALGRDIKQLDWMSTTTKMEALSKLGAVRNKVGYPSKWRDYSSLAIRTGDALGNAQRAAAFEHNRWLKKIDTPVDLSEWHMTPPTVNAYYSASENDINFPAGILQAPFFNDKADVATNFGAIGAIIGHELSHGFDDQGRQFDAKGNLRDWWTPDDASHFVERAKCFEDQYNTYAATADGTINVNGKLTLGENIADNGGVRVALMALTDMIAAQAAPPTANQPEQRFFLGWAQAWCESITPEAARMAAQVDSHSPPRYRVNGVVANEPEFAMAFGCKPNNAMVRAPSCRVW